MISPRSFASFSLPILACTCGCGPSTGATGELAFFLEAEDTITDGLVPGDAPEDVVDGWSVTYEHFVVTVGHIHATSRATGLGADDEGVWVVDLVSIPATGLALATFELPAGTYDDVGYTISVAAAGAMRDDSVPAALFDEMVAGGCTYLIEGELANETESVDFRFCIPAPTTFGPCSTPDGMEGVVVTAGGTTSTSLTFHGDHMWFDAFPSGDELVSRRGAWLAACDADGDGIATAAELMSAAPAEVFPSSEYNLSGSPVAIDDAWDFLVAQVKTQGHLNGEGECPWDGTP